MVAFAKTLFLPKKMESKSESTWLMLSCPPPLLTPSTFTTFTQSKGEKGVTHTLKPFEHLKQMFYILSMQHFCFLYLFLLVSVNLKSLSRLILLETAEKGRFWVNLCQTKLLMRNNCQQKRFVWGLPNFNWCF